MCIHFYREMFRDRNLRTIYCNVAKLSAYYQLIQYVKKHVKKVKVKWSRYMPDVAQTVGRCIALLFHDRGTRRCEWSAARPGRTLPTGKPQCPFYRRLSGPQGRSGRAENLIPTGIRSRTVQPVVDRYIDWAIRPTLKSMLKLKIDNKEQVFERSILKCNKIL